MVKGTTGKGITDPSSLGARIASLLRGSWRASPPPLDFPLDDLEILFPLLLKSGAAPLAWWRIAHSGYHSFPSVAQLHQAYRLSTIQALVQERQLAEVLRRLAQNNVTPLMGKGLVAARLYPEPGLRPSGDFDLYVPDEQYEIARATLRIPGTVLAPVDLHRGFAELDDRPPELLYRRAQTITIDGQEVRVFSPEDHLRLLCLHMLRHGAVRPLWLCDIAATLESLSKTFDWDYFSSGSTRRTQWAWCALVLAQKVFDLARDYLPLSDQMKTLPRWIIPAVLREWGTPYHPRIPTEYAIRSPRMILKEIRHKWPNPIEATVTVNARFDNFPRFPIQLADCAVRAVHLIRRVLRATATHTL
ncbi:MAG TPA: nucleotidyltransferase family protein [Blastocatellia bacterium]|nr:nucleotidyltransferase family protein [Blastocatellia bacterium]